VRKWLVYVAVKPFRCDRSSVNHFVLRGTLRIRAFGEPKVRKHGIASVWNQDVVRLNIEMYKASRMDVVESCKKSDAAAYYLSDGKKTGVKGCIDRAGYKVRHRDIDEADMLAPVMDRQDRVYGWLLS